MSESPVGTLEKALGLHFISKMGLTCLWKLESHVEFTASNCDDAWQFFNIASNPNITVSNRKRDVNAHLNSRSFCIFLPCLGYIPELSLIPRQVPDFNEQTRVSNGLPLCNSRIYPKFLPQLEKTHETFPSLRDEARFPCIACRAIAIFPIKHIRSLDLLDWTPESPQQHSHKTRRTLMSPQECKIDRGTQFQIEMRPISLALAP